MRTRFMSMVLAVALMAIGCATQTQINSQRDPSVPPGSFDHILIEAAVDEFEVQQAIESAFASHLYRSGYSSVASTELFFARKDYSQSEIDATLASNQVQAALIITELGKGSTSHFVPEHKTTKTYLQDLGDGDSREVTVESTGGGYEKETGRWVVYGAELIDLGTGRVVWFGEARTESSQENWYQVAAQDFLRMASTSGGQLASQFLDDEVMRLPRVDPRAPRAAKGDVPWPGQVSSDN